MEYFNNIITKSSDMISNDICGYFTIQGTDKYLFLAVHDKENLKKSNEIILTDPREKRLIFIHPISRTKAKE